SLNRPFPPAACFEPPLKKRAPDPNPGRAAIPQGHDQGHDLAFGEVWYQLSLAAWAGELKTVPAAGAWPIPQGSPPFDYRGGRFRTYQPLSMNGKLPATNHANRQLGFFLKVANENAHPSTQPGAYSDSGTGQIRKHFQVRHDHNVPSLHLADQRSTGFAEDGV